MNRLLLTFCCSLLLTGLFAQQRTVTGKVTDQSDGSVLPGVSVVIRGTSQGTSTDSDGIYSLQASPSDVLIFSFIGFSSQEITVGERSQIDVALPVSTRSLDEVVVIGYGSREKKDVTGAISQINSEEITRQVTMTPELAMQGRMPGVFVSNPGSSPTARPQIRIRGVGTLGINDPLYVIDGIPLIEGGSNNMDARVQDLRGPINLFALINPNDIESMSVLKDASATAIYGVRAANGVVLITTKRGKAGKPRLDFSASAGVQNIRKRYDVMSVQEYVAISNEAFTNRNFTPPAAYGPLFDPSSPDYLGNSDQYTRDWEDAVVRKNATIQDYSINLSGGNEASNYSVGLGYSDQENVIYSSRFKRYSFSVNSDHKIGRWLKIGETLRLVYSQNDEDAGVSNLGSFVIPWQPLYDENDPLGYARSRRSVAGAIQNEGYGPGGQNNMLALGELNYNRRDVKRGIASVYGEVSPFEGFRIRGTYSVDYLTNTREQYIDLRSALYMPTQGVARTAIGNEYGRRINENINLVGEFLIGYTKTFDEHSVDVVLNAMDQRVFWNNTQEAIANASPIPNWDQRRIDEGWPNANKTLLYDRVPSGLQGYMARVSYDFSKKYYFDATVRRDGTSQFGQGYRWGTFPSFGAAWRVSSEPFMANQNFLSDLKIRAGWGRIGNQDVGRPFAFLGLINVNPKAAFGSDASQGPGNGFITDGAGAVTIPTVNLSWEIVTNTNVAIETEFLKGKLRFVAEYYSRFTDGILQSSPIPATSGYVVQPVLNLAQVSNRGFEFDVMMREQVGDIGFSIGVNVTTVRNRVEQLFNDIPQGGTEDRRQVGYPINYLWGYQTNGIFRTPQEVTEYLSTTADPGLSQFKAPGDVRFVDFAGAPAPGSPSSVYSSVGPDGTVNFYDQTYLGKTIPGYYGGVTLGANWKNFDLNVLFRYTGDVQRVFRLGLESIGGAGGNYPREYLDRWTPENPNSNVPRAINGDPSGNNRFSDRFVHDAGFVRLQNVQLGYNIRAPFVQRTGISNLRVTATGQNLFVISSFPDLDPENITTPTVFMLGLNLGL